MPKNLFTETDGLNLNILLFTRNTKPPPRAKLVNVPPLVNAPSLLKLKRTDYKTNKIRHGFSFSGRESRKGNHSLLKEDPDLERLKSH